MLVIHARAHATAASLLQALRGHAALPSTAHRRRRAITFATSRLRWPGLSEQAGLKAFSLGKFRRPRTAVNVNIELVFLENTPRIESTNAFETDSYVPAEELATFGSASDTSSAPQ